MAESLSKWMASNGGCMSPDLDFFQALPGGDRGVVAAKNFEKGDALVYTPLTLCIHMPTEEDFPAEGEQQDEAATFLRGLAEPLNSFLSTVLLLMHELSKGPKSEYEPFLSLLPASHDCTLGWTDEEVAELAGTSIAHTGRTKTAQEFDTLVRPVMEQRPDLWPPSGCDFEAFVYAAGMVQSRAFHVKKENWLTGELVEGEELYLIPGIDMINHSSRPQERNTALEQLGDDDGKTSISFCRAPDQPVEDYKGLFFIMKAGRKIAAGEQVLHTYGDLSDAQLLQTYGFVEDPARPNPQNRNVRLPTIDLEKAIKLLRRHHKACGTQDNSWINIEQVEGRLLAGNPGHDDLFKLAAYYVTGKAECMIMLSLVDKQLDGMLAAPNARIKAKDATGRLRMAAVVREAEKKALEQLKHQIFSLLMSSPDQAENGAFLVDEPCMGDLLWEQREDEIYPEPTYSSQDDYGSEEEGEGSGDDSGGSEQEDIEEDSEEKEDGAEVENGVEASSSPEEEAKSSEKKRGRSAGANAPSADEAALLSASVLPATEKRGRRSSTLSLRTGDPVRKRLKF